MMFNEKGAAFDSEQSATEKRRGDRNFQKESASFDRRLNQIWHPFSRTESSQN